MLDFQTIAIVVKSVYMEHADKEHGGTEKKSDYNRGWYDCAMLTLALLEATDKGIISVDECSKRKESDGHYGSTATYKQKSNTKTKEYSEEINV